MLVFVCGSNACMQQIYKCMLLSEVGEKKLDIEPDRVTWS